MCSKFEEITYFAHVQKSVSTPLLATAVTSQVLLDYWTLKTSGECKQTMMQTQTIT